MSAFVIIPADGKAAVRAGQSPSLQALWANFSGLVAKGLYASIDRVDLAEVEAVMGRTYTQRELLPREVFEELRHRYRVEARVLLPPEKAGEAVIMLLDSCGGLKGLPHNERATRQLAACGLSGDVRGDCAVCRLSLSDAGTVDMLDFQASDLLDRQWLELAQKKNARADRSDLAAPVLRAVEAVAAAPAVEPVTAPVEAPAHDEGTAAAAGPPEYTWEDAKSDVTVTIDVPQATTNGDVRCTFMADWLRVDVATLPAGARTVVEGRLFQRVDPDTCVWTLDTVTVEGKSARKLVLTLEKEKEMRWLELTRKA